MSVPELVALASALGKLDIIQHRDENGGGCLVAVRAGVAMLTEEEHQALLAARGFSG